MLTLLFLGTSGAIPSVERACPATLVVCQGKKYLVDCGEGTQRQLYKSGISIGELSGIFITHHHLDHVLGLGGLLLSLSLERSSQTLDIWGSRSALARVRWLHRMVRTRGEPSVHIRYRQVRDGHIVESMGLSIEAFRTSHRHGYASFGYIFSENKPPHFLAEKATALGVPFGPERSKLLHGQSVTLPGGRVITPDEVLEPRLHGHKVALTGDTRYIQSLPGRMAGCCCLVASANFASAEEELADQVGHMTAQRAAILAREVGAKKLYLIHFSKRYAYPQSELLAEAREVFPYTVIPEDLSWHSCCNS